MWYAKWLKTPFWTIQLRWHHFLRSFQSRELLAPCNNMQCHKKHLGRLGTQYLLCGMVITTWNIFLYLLYTWHMILIPFHSWQSVAETEHKKSQLQLRTEGKVVNLALVTKATPALKKQTNKKNLVNKSLPTTLRSQCSRLVNSHEFLMWKETAPDVCLYWGHWRPRDGVGWRGLPLPHSQGLNRTLSHPEHQPVTTNNSYSRVKVSRHAMWNDYPVLNSTVTW